MKEYKNYNLEDFLLDDSFRNWVLGEDVRLDELWIDISQRYPEKQAIILQAKDLILTWRKQNSALTNDEIEFQISRILKSTEQESIPEYKVATVNWKWWTAAATVVLALGIGWLTWRGIKPSPQPFTYNAYVTENPVPLKEIVNTTDKSLKITLPDSSIIELTPKSKISYAQPFVINKKREVFLSGEAFFRVTKDVQNPFFVYANGLLTRVVGTCFLVKASGENVEVLVRSGRVSVVAMKDVNNQKKRNTELLLTPNQQATFSAKDNLISKSIIEIPLALVKIDAKPDFNFENKPISSVFSTLEKVYGIPFVYDNTIMNKCFLRVKLNDEPFFTKLDIICQTIGASYRISDGQVIITSEGCQ
ncbi:FecR family protein [Dyadobacter subterraneus]|uniref:FecR family protein n=1 Tax=Dyadobacter subterraneus TaxID=2773304 RepID=A0ABR9WA25_9BACT|nr:FecR family protein [Dyadobacter subterraneus]MBE9462305.1 FecR family protein [Dyadobacter subterraneus]